MFLNILKILGLVLSTSAGAVATLSETKTPDKMRLTVAGKSLLFLGIVGFFLAAGAQLQEWREKEKEKQTQEMASRQRTEKLLAEISRAVTRLETIAIDIRLYFPIEEQEFRFYNQRLQGIINGMVGTPAGAIKNGLRVITTQLATIRILSTTENSPALPNEKDGDAEHLLRLASQTHIEIYKKSIGPKAFSEPDPQNRKPDLVLVAQGGTESVLIVLDDFAQIQGAEYKRTGMAVPNTSWSASGRILSMDDLSGCQAVVWVPFTGYKGVGRMWPPLTLTLYLNNQRFEFSLKDLKPAGDTPGNSGFIFTFPDKLTPSD